MTPNSTLVASLKNWFPAMPTAWTTKCRVCGLDQEAPPWGEDGWRVPSFDICACCGCEFGMDDFGVGSVVAYRLRWLTAGATWFQPRERPDDWEWTLVAQLARVPPPFAAMAEISSVADFWMVFENYGPAACASAAFTSTSLVRDVILDSALGALILCYQPYVDTEQIEWLLQRGDADVYNALLSRPELAWREDWKDLIEANAPETGGAK